MVITLLFASEALASPGSCFFLSCHRDLCAGPVVAKEIQLEVSLGHEIAEFMRVSRPQRTFDVV